MAFRTASAALCRPSDLYNIVDPVEAFRFDRAVILFGDTLEGELQAVEGKNSKEIASKRQRILDKWIPEASAGFKDPASIGTGT